jgi:hypothetical protein
VERKYYGRVEGLWNAVLGAFKPKKELSYLPTVFVIPFYPYVQSVIGHDPVRGDLIDRRRMDALTSCDADNPDKWAIYLVYGLVKKAYDRLFMAILAEELTHFYMRLKGVSKAAEVWKLTIEGKGQETSRKTSREARKGATSTPVAVHAILLPLLPTFCNYTFAPVGGFKLLDN